MQYRKMWFLLISASSDKAPLKVVDVHQIEFLMQYRRVWFLLISASSDKAPLKVEDVRQFEYTRQQWTGKHPKQFLIDWCRKHLPKSPPPKYHKIQVKYNRFKCR